MMLTARTSNVIGLEGLLTITVSSYDNRGILCTDPAQTPFLAPRFESCLLLIDEMEKSDEVRGWGDVPSQVVDSILLPKDVPSRMFSTARR